MAGSPTVRLPSDPLHPDHEMYQRLLSGVQDLQRCRGMARTRGKGGQSR